MSLILINTHIEQGHRKVRTSVKAIDDINKQLGDYKMVLLELEKVYPKVLLLLNLLIDVIEIYLL